MNTHWKFMIFEHRPISITYCKLYVSRHHTTPRDQLFASFLETRWDIYSPVKGVLRRGSGGLRVGSPDIGHRILIWQNTFHFLGKFSVIKTKYGVKQTD